MEIMAENVTFPAVKRGAIRSPKSSEISAAPRNALDLLDFSGFFETRRDPGGKVLPPGP
jgi:hypothetical protein